jgi:hypothetical protein
MSEKMHVTVRDSHRELSVSGYWSNRYDVLALEGDEDDTHIVIAASFQTRDDANAYRETQRQVSSSRYVFAVRPPRYVVDDAIAWLSDVTNAHGEGIPFVAGRS